MFISVGVIMNDETVHQLCKQAVSQVKPLEDLFSISNNQNDLNFLFYLLMGNDISLAL